MKKLTSTMMQQTLNKQDRRLTVGLDLGDRSSFYCVLDEAGEVLMEQRLSTTPKAIPDKNKSGVGALDVASSDAINLPAARISGRRVCPSGVPAMA